MKVDTREVQILIAIITYKRPKGLNRLLTCLTHQNIPSDITLSICVVDNDLTSKNKKIISKFANSFFSIAYIKEHKRGIVYARNCAVKFFIKSNNSALIFIDDDEWPDQDNWVSNYVNIYRKTMSPIITGAVITIPEEKKSMWIKNAIGTSFSKTKHLQPIKKFYTNNLFLHRCVLEKVQPAFDNRFQMTGSSDLHFSKKCQLASFMAVYANNVVVNELFPKTRSTVLWFVRRGFRNGSGASRACLIEDQSVLSYLYCVYIGVLRSVRGFYTCFKGLLQLNKGIFVNGLMRISSGIGSLVGIFGISYQEYQQTHGQ